MDNILGTVFAKLIMALGIAGVATLAYTGIIRQKENDVISQMSQININVSTNYAGQSTGYTGFTTAILTTAANGLLPSETPPGNVTVSAVSATAYTVTLVLPTGVSCNRIWMSLGAANTNSQATSCATPGSFIATFS